MSEITIKDHNREVTGWSKNITLEYKGDEYLVTLYWDNCDGYDITFHNKTNSTPSWAWKLIEIDNGDENLYEILDNLTEGESNE
jgi:hypothetical protein